MPKMKKPPRLWLRPAQKDRSSVWTVLDSGRQIATGYEKSRESDAKEFLRLYMERNYQNGWKGASTEERLLKRGIIYFMTLANQPDYPIKIGYSTRESFRCRKVSMQIAHPFKIVFLKTIAADRSDEYALHHDFSHLRIRGEWFERSPELMDFIDNVPAY